MNYFRVLLSVELPKKALIIALLCQMTTNAQSPGGISTNLNLWLKANTGVTGTSTVTNWTDNSTQTNNATGVAPAPSYVTTGATLFNYNPYLQFTAASSQLLTLTAAKNPLGSGTQARTFYTVAFPSSAADENIVIGQGTNATGTTNQGRHLRYIANTNRLIVDTDGRVRGSASSTINKPVIATFSIAASETQALSASSVGAINGTATSITSYTNGSASSSINTASTLAQIGHRPAETNYFDGRIAEIISYPSLQHSATQKQQVESYLAIKYGITLPNNYLNSSSGTIFSITAPYTNNIIGIAREDNSGLIQRQSHTYDDSVRVYLSGLAATNAANTGTFALSSSQSVIMGASTGMLRSGTATGTEKPLTIFSRLDREWKVTNTNFTGSFNWDVTLASGNGSVSVSDLRLLVDTDGDFSDATVYSSLSGLTFSYSGTTVTVAGIPILLIPTNSTRYITLASVASTTPLPVEWLSFKGQCRNKGADLQWTVASEKENDHFTVERSLNARDFQPVGIVKGGGTTSHLSSYSYTDAETILMIRYYRLKQTDFSGQYHYSAVISVDCSSGNTSSSFLIYPNPSQTNQPISISFDPTTHPYTRFSIQEISGRQIESGNLISSGQDAYTMQAKLAKGIYVVRLYGEGVISKFEKMVVN